MEKENEIIEINYNYIIPYNYRDDRYGRAEFEICPIFKRGIMRELYIDPLQQPNYFGKMFKVNLEGVPIRTLHLTGYPYGKDPWVWRTLWCKEHKCYSLVLYAADNTSSLTPVTHFGSDVTLEFS